MDNEVFPSMMNPSFQQRYRMGRLPLTLVKDEFGQSIKWLIPLDNLDFSYFLPIFFEGLRETEEPFEMIADVGLHELLSKGGYKVSLALPYLMNPLCYGLTSINPAILIKSLLALQHLYDVTGISLYPYYNRLMPILNDLKQNAEYIEACAHPRELEKGYFGKIILDTIHYLEQRL